MVLLGEGRTQILRTTAPFTHGADSVKSPSGFKSPQLHYLQDHPLALGKEHGVRGMNQGFDNSSCLAIADQKEQRRLAKNRATASVSR